MRIEQNPLQCPLNPLGRYLPSFPYQDNPVLHTYAGLLCIFLSQSEDEFQGEFLDLNLGSGVTTKQQYVDTSAHNPTTLRDAQSHLERARALDIDNTVASGFLELVPFPTQSRNASQTDSIICGRYLLSCRSHRRRNGGLGRSQEQTLMKNPPLPKLMDRVHGKKESALRRTIEADTKQ